MSKYAPKYLDRNEAQFLYDSGLSIRDLMKHYSVSLNTIVRLKLLTRPRIEARRLKKGIFSEEDRKRRS